MRIIILAGLILACSSSFASPESDYMIHCMGCHLSNGQGLPPDVPAFDSKLEQLAASAAGRAYLVRVPGAAQAPLNDHALAEVLNWILSSYTSQAFERFSAEEVTTHRQEIMIDPAAVRATLVSN